MHRGAPAWRRYLRFGGPNVRADVDDEIAFHVETTAQTYIARGESPEHARRLALDEFGDLPSARKQCYTIGERQRKRRERGELFTALGQDVRYAVRVLRDSPAFTLGVTIMIALAMAANAAAFSVLDRLLVRPPAFLVAPEQVHRLYETTGDGGAESISTVTSYHRFTDIAAHAHAFATLAAMREGDAVIRAGRQIDQLRVAYVSAGFWELFDAVPVLGRFPSVRDESSTTPAGVAVLSYDYWRTRFHADSDVVGTTVSIGETHYRIIGVAPAKFSGLSIATPSMWMPLDGGVDPLHVQRGPPAESYRMNWLEIVGRTRRDWSNARAADDLTAALASSVTSQRAVGAETPFTPDPSNVRGLLGPIQKQRGPMRTDETRVALWLGAVAVVVLLVAALNVANLMLARTVRRQREIAVRLALGASTLRLVRLLFVEAVLVVTIGAALGLTLVAWLGDAMHARFFTNTNLPSVGVDAQVVAFTALCGVAAALPIAVAPTVRALRWSVAAAMNDGAVGGSLRRSRLRGSLLVLQTAFSLALLVGAGLFVRSLHNVRALPLGYDPEHVLVVTTLSGASKTLDVDPTLAAVFIRRALSIRGVDAAAQSVTLPFSKFSTHRFSAPGVAADATHSTFLYNVVSPSYFQTVGTRVVAGRGFTEGDDGSHERVVIVSAPMAARLWPGHSAVGQCLTFDHTNDVCVRVVGVSEATRHWSFGEDEMLDYYVPIAQDGSPKAAILLRTRGNARTIADVVQHQLDTDTPDGVRVSVRPMQDAIDGAARSWRVGAGALSILALFALALAAVGMYGMLAYDLAERQRDVGIRLALGATPAHLVRAGLASSLRVAAAGLAVGLSLAFVAGPWIGALLFRVSSRDPVTFAIAGLVMLAAFVVASAVPALRAARADPALILRSG